MATAAKSKEQLKKALTDIKDMGKKAAEGNTTPVSTTPDASKFVYMDKVRESLELSYFTGENLILFGPGGHGKSELVEWFLENKGHVPYIKTMGAGTTTEQLFGGIDLKKFNETGQLEFLVENSFMNHEYVVFEELMDAPDYILEQLKDILTSKKFRQGGQVFPIKTKLIICCTNRNREEFSKNDSLKALMERFPLEYKVQWDNYTRTTYGFLFKTLFGRNFKTLEYILEKLAQASSTVSPRTAVKVAKVLEKNGNDYSCLQFFADFSGKNDKMVKEEIKKYKALEEIENKIEAIDLMVAEASTIELTNLDNAKRLRTLIRDINSHNVDLRTKKGDDEAMKIINTAISKFDAFIVSKGEEVKKMVEGQK